MVYVLGERFRKWMTFIGVGLMMFPTGSSYFWGNAHVYISSRIRHRLDTEVGVMGPWVLSIQIAVSAIVAVCAGFIRTHFGNDACIIAGTISVCANGVIAYFTIQYSSVLFTVMYGLIFGLCLGLLMNNAINFLLEWLDNDNAGLCIAFSRSFRFLGAVLVNQFMTLYVNRDNLKPDSRNGPTTLFSQSDVLDRVPYMVLYLGVGLSAFAFTGFAMVKLANCKCTLFAPNTKDSHHVKRIHDHRSLDLEVPDNLQEHQRTNESPQSGNISPSSTTSLEGGGGEGKREEGKNTVSYTTSQMLKSKNFYVLFVSLFLSYVTNLVVSNYYKSFGQVWIHDDHFLTYIGSLIPVINIFSTMAWGKCMDWCGVKTFLVFFHSIVPLLCLVYYFTVIEDWLYVITTWVFSSVTSATFNTYNIATIKAFGRKHQASNFGVMHLATLSDLLLSPLIKTILLEFGWFHLFLFVALMNVATLIIIVVLL